MNGVYKVGKITELEKNINVKEKLYDELKLENFLNKLKVSNRKK